MSAASRRARSASTAALSAAVLAAGAAAAAGPGRAQPDAAPLAIVGARWLRHDGPAVDGVTVVVRGDRVSAIGPAVVPPPDARRLDAAGLVLTAGLVGVSTPLGLEEIALEADTVDSQLEAEGADPIRAAFRAADGFNPRSTAIPVARLEGVTSAVVTPRGGLVPGTSAFVDLDGTPAAPGVVDAEAALHVSLDEGGIAAAGGARPAAFARLRQALEDAALYARRRGEFDARRLRDLAVSRPDLERLADALAGRLPVVVHASRADDLVRALELGARFGLRLVLAGAEEGHLVADAIAAARVPVIVQPLTNLPQSFARLASRYDNAARLHRAGVAPLVVAAEGPHELRNLRQEAGNAVAAGLPYEVALGAVTRAPAEVFGAADHGALAPGRVASLVLWSGDPLEVTTTARHVLVRGRQVPLRSRQTALFERYRDLDRLRGPRAGSAPSPRETR